MLIGYSLRPAFRHKPASQKGVKALKNKNSLMVLTLLCSLGMGRPNPLAGENDFLSELEALSFECVSTAQGAVCRRALIKAEVLQREAASIGNYACQSHLLGLGSDLLMVSHKANRADSLFGMLKQVHLLCGDL